MQCRWGFVAAAVAAAAFFAGAWIVTRRRSETPPPRPAAVSGAVPEGPLKVYREVRLPDVQGHMTIRGEHEFPYGFRRDETLRRIYSARYPVDFTKQMIVVAHHSTPDQKGSLELDSVYQTSREIVFRARFCNPPPGERPANKRHSVGAVLDISWLPIRFEILTDPSPVVPRPAPTIPVPVHRFLRVRPIQGAGGIKVIQDAGDYLQDYRDVYRNDGSMQSLRDALPADLDIDFSKHMIVVCHGTHPNLSRRIKIHEVLKSHGEILVRLREWSESEVAALAIRPYAMAFVVDQSDLPIRFEIFRDAK